MRKSLIYIYHGKTKKNMYNNCGYGCILHIVIFLKQKERDVKTLG